MRRSFSLVFAILLASANATERARRSYIGRRGLGFGGGGGFGFGGGSGGGGGVRDGFGGGLEAVHKGGHGIFGKVQEKSSHLGAGLSGGIGGGLGENLGGRQGLKEGGSEKGSHSYGSEETFVINGSGSNVGLGGGSRLGSAISGSEGLDSSHGGSAKLEGGSVGSFGGSFVGGVDHENAKKSGSGNEKGSHGSGETFIPTDSTSSSGLGESSSSDVTSGGSGRHGLVHGGSGLLEAGSVGGFEGKTVVGLDSGHSKGSGSSVGKGRYGSEGAFVINSSGSNVGLGGDSTLGGAISGSGGLDSSHGGSAKLEGGSVGSFGGSFVGGLDHGNGKKSGSGTEKGSHGNGETIIATGSTSSSGLGQSIRSDVTSGGSGRHGTVHGGSGLLAAGSAGGFGGKTVAGLDSGHNEESGSTVGKGRYASGGAFVTSNSGSNVGLGGGSSLGGAIGGSGGLDIGHEGSSNLEGGSIGSFRGSIVGGVDHGHAKKSGSGNEKGSQGSGETFIPIDSTSSSGLGESSSSDITSGGSGRHGLVHGGSGLLEAGSVGGFGGKTVAGLDSGHNKESGSTVGEGRYGSGGAFIIKSRGSNFGLGEGSKLGGAISSSGGLDSSHGGSAKLEGGSVGSFGGSFVGGIDHGNGKKSGSGNEKGSQGSGETFIATGSTSSSGLGQRIRSDITSGGSGRHGTVHGGSGLLAAGSAGGFGGKTVAGLDSGHNKESGSTVGEGRYGGGGAFVIKSRGSNVGLGEGSKLVGAISGSGGLDSSHGGSAKLEGGSVGSFGGSFVGGVDHGNGKKSGSGNEKGSQGSGKTFIATGSTSSSGLGQRIRSDVTSGGSGRHGTVHGGSGLLAAGLAGGFGGKTVAGLDSEYSKGSGSAVEKGSYGSGGAFVINSSGSNVALGGGSKLGGAISGSGGLDSSHGGSAKLEGGSVGSFGGSFVGGVGHGNGKKSGSGNEKGSHGSGESFIATGSTSSSGLGQSIRSDFTSGGSGRHGTVHGGSGLLAAGSAGGFGGKTVAGLDSGHNKESGSTVGEGRYGSGGAFVIKSRGSNVVLGGGSKSGGAISGSGGLDSSHGGSAKLEGGSVGSFGGSFVGSVDHGNGKKSGSGNEKGSQGNGETFIATGSTSSSGFGQRIRSDVTSGGSGRHGTVHGGSGLLAAGSAGGFGGKTVANLDSGHNKESGSTVGEGRYGSGEAFVIKSRGSNVGLGGGSKLGGAISGSGGLDSSHGGSAKLEGGSVGSFGGSFVGGVDHGNGKKSGSGNEKGSQGSGKTFIATGSTSSSGLGQRIRSDVTSGGSGRHGTVHGGSGLLAAGSAGGFGGKTVAGLDSGHSKGSGSAVEKGSYGSGGAFVINSSGSNVALGGGSKLGGAISGFGGLDSSHGGSAKLEGGSVGGFGGSFVGGVDHGNGKKSGSGNEKGSQGSGETFIATGSTSSSGLGQGIRSDVTSGGSGRHGTVHGGSGLLAAGSAGGFGGKTVANLDSGHNKESGSTVGQGRYGSGEAFVIKSRGSNVGLGGGSKLGGAISGSGGLDSSHGGSAKLEGGSVGSFGGSFVGVVDHGNGKKSGIGNEKGSHGSGETFIATGSTSSSGLGQSIRSDVTSGGSGSHGTVHGGSGLLAAGAAGGFGGKTVVGLDNGHSKGSGSAVEKGSYGSGGAFVINSSGSNVALGGGSKLGGAISGSGGLDSSHGGSAKLEGGSVGSFGGSVVGSVDHGNGKKSGSGNEKGSQGSGETFITTGSTSSSGLGQRIRSDVTSGGSGRHGTVHGGSGLLAAGSAGGFGGKTVVGLDSGHSKGSGSAVEKGSYGSGGAFVINSSGSNVALGGGSKLGGAISGSGGLDSSHGGSAKLEGGSVDSFGGSFVGGVDHGNGKKSGSGNEKGSQGSGETFIATGSTSSSGLGQRIRSDVTSGGSGRHGTVHGGSGLLAAGSAGGFGGKTVAGLDSGHSKGSGSAVEKGSYGSGGAFVINSSGSNVGLGGGSKLGGAISGFGGLDSSHGGSAKLEGGSVGGFGGSFVGGVDHGNGKKSGSGNEKGSQGSGESFIATGSTSSSGLGQRIRSDVTSGGSGRHGTVHGGSGLLAAGSAGGFGGKTVAGLGSGHSKGSGSAVEKGSYGSGGAFVINSSGSNVALGGGSKLGGAISGSGGLDSSHGGSAKLEGGSVGGFGGSFVGGVDHGNGKKSGSGNEKGSQGSGETFIATGSTSSSGLGQRIRSDVTSGGSGRHGTVHGGSGLLAAGSAGGFGGKTVAGLDSGHNKESGSTVGKGRYGSGGAFVTSSSGSNNGLVGGNSLGGAIGASGGLDIGHEGSVNLEGGSTGSLRGSIVGGVNHGYSKKSGSGNEKESHGSGKTFITTGSTSSSGLGESISSDVTSGGSGSHGFVHGGSGLLAAGSAGGFGGKTVVGLDSIHSKGSGSTVGKGSYGSEGTFVTSSSGSNVSFGGGSSLGGAIGGSGGLYIGHGGSAKLEGGSTGSFRGSIVGGVDHGNAKKSGSGNEKGSHGSGETFIATGSTSSSGLGESSSSDVTSGGSGSHGIVHGGFGLLAAGSASGFGGKTVVGLDSGHSKGSGSTVGKGSYGSGGAFVTSSSGSNVGLGKGSSLRGGIGGSGGLDSSHGGSAKLEGGSVGSFQGSFVGGVDHGSAKKSGSGNEKENHGSGGALVTSSSGSGVGLGGRGLSGGSGGFGSWSSGFGSYGGGSSFGGGRGGGNGESDGSTGGHGGGHGMKWHESSSFGISAVGSTGGGVGDGRGSGGFGAGSGGNGGQSGGGRLGGLFDGNFGLRRELGGGFGGSRGHGSSGLGISSGGCVAGICG